MQVYIPGKESLIKWLEDTSYPNTTLSWNIISGSSMIEQETKKPATYFITVGNLNSEAVKVQLNFNIKAVLYNTTQAYFKCSLCEHICSFNLFLLKENAIVLTSLDSGQAKAEEDRLQARQGGCRAGETGQEAHNPLLSSKDNDLSTWGSYISVSQEEDRDELVERVYLRDDMMTTSGEIALLLAWRTSGRRSYVGHGTPNTPTAIILLITSIPIFLKTYSSSSSSSSFGVAKDGKTNRAAAASSTTEASGSGSSRCDIFSGEWVPNPEAPYYTNRSCWAIHEHQNCMKYGRPDTEFMRWRWKPDGCDLPIFNPSQFLEIVRGKSLAFVGDSVGRNQMQSLICLLSRVEYPIDVSYTPDEHFKRWLYTTYNFTLATFWTPFLVKAKQDDPAGPTGTGLFGLYLDEFDESWTTQIDEFDYLVVSAATGFYRSLMYHKNGR
ncbi:hypothetical protein Nepgr_029022 [Nepenthes gracilis]|uniref:Trichome birefringence-like N-terminal domain-containing protein n=1 Tax=Nepenthes gracilis TaxID=150966 RepID=A0AAD3Y4L8_NEPGR|nr:hypothetical protein Nepgr_029022 [Nepenthes gracilis]